MTVDSARDVGDRSRMPQEPGAARHPRRAGRRRFRWPLKVFLGFFLFDMTVRSVVSLTPFDDEWRKELKLRKLPPPLPTAAQREKIARGDHPKYSSMTERYLKVGRGLVRYFNPIPSEKSLKRIDSNSQALKYAVTWLGTRLGFWGRISGVDQNWPMFSPNVRRKRTVTHIRLVYADQSMVSVRLLPEPRRLTSFSRWFVKRPLQVQLKLHKSADSRKGMDNYLRHRYGQNQSGSPLKRIDYYKLRYRWPKPKHNAHKYLRKQQRKARKSLEHPYYRYSVATNRGRWLEKKKSKKKKEAK